ncbi:hypothetical protein DYB34_004108 [Aphanomyces astaci]|uniref:Fibronectin type-III domain-containing protein n=2 Tax=Aphanomyces astaci TaxID=112090 RepID=A0A3R6ZML6_APHAT|nr:hypothetical protein DYB34_004108 [Aphanomyces astaci]
MSMNKLQMQLKKKEKERKAAAKKGSATSTESKAKAAADAQAFQCKICLTPFPRTSKGPQMIAHAESKHPRVSPEERPTLQREVSGVRALAFVFKRCPALHVWVMKLKFHESIHGLFAFFAEVLIGICLFTAALSSRRAFGAVYYVLFVGRLAVWSFWTPRLLPSQGITQMPTPGHPRAPSPPLLKRTASNQDHPDKLVMAVPTESLAGNMSTEVDAVILTTYRTGGEQTITMPPPHPLINKPIVQGLLLYTFSVLVLWYVKPLLPNAIPSTVATNWLGYVFLVAVSNLYICLAKMLSFYASYDDLPQTTPARRQAQVPVIMRVLRNELVATSIAMFWAISYPSYASLGLFALAMLALVTHGLHDSVQFKSASTIQPLLLSITTVYGVCTGLVQYALTLPALHPFVSTNQFALLGYTELDLAIQNAALVGLCLCQRARWRYPRPASFVPTMGASTEALDNNTSSGATPGTPSVSIPALTTLWSSPLFNAQLVLIAQVVLQLVLYSRTWHHVPPTTNVVSTETTRDTLPWYFLSTLVGEIDRVFRSGGVIVCYIVLLLLAFNWELRRGHVTVVGFIQLALFCALVDSHISNIVQFPRGTAHYGKLWRLVLIVQVVVVVLRYLYQFDPVSQAILTHWLPTFCTMDDIGFDSLSSKTHLSNLFAYLFPTIVMAGLAAWQLASMSAVPEMRWEFPSSFKFQREWRHLCHALSSSSSLLVGLAVILATDSINLMGFLYYMSAVYAVLKRQYMAAWPYLFTTSSFVLLSTYVLQLNLPLFNTPEATQTGQWLGMARLDDTMSLWTVNRVPLVMIGLCALQRLGSVLLPPPTAAADTDEADKPPPWWEVYTNHVAPVFTRDTHVTILMLSLLVSSFVHLNVVSMAYMVAVRGIMLADWDDPTVHHRCIRRLTILLVGVSVAQYLVQLWFPPWLVAPQPTLPPWTWLDPPYQAWLMLHFQNKWSLLADFMALFSVYLIAPPPPVAAPSGPLSSDNPCIMPSEVPAAGPALATTTTTILPPPPPPYQVFVANYSIVVVLVWVFITGCAQFGVASGLYLGWSIYMLFHLDRLDWQPVLLGSLQSYNWFYLLLLVVYQCPWFNDITQTCTLGTNQPLGDGICLSLPVALGLYKAPRNIDSTSPSSSSSGPASSTKLSIAIFVMIAIQMQVFASAPYRLVLENHRKEQDRCQKRGYAMNDELARHRIQQWRYLKLEKQAAIQRLKAIVSKLVNKVEEMMDIAMGLHYSLPPMAPHRPTVLSKSQNSITLAWTAPDSKMHKIRGYRISRQTFPSVTLLGDFGDTVTVRANQRTAEITGLRPGTSYQFKVAAHRRRDAISTRSKPRHPPPPPAAASLKGVRRQHWQTYLLAQVTSLDLSETQIQLDEMSPLLYCIEVTPIVLLGLYKFDGSATASVGSTFQGLQWNFLVICSILFHRRELQMRGFWVYPGNEALKWTQTALWRRLFRSRRSFNLDTNSTRSLEDLPQRDPLALPDSHQMEDIERADRLARMDSKDSLDERDFELADYLAKTHEPTLSNHQPSHSSTDLSTHVARLLEKDELPPLKLNPLAPSFDYDSSGDSSDDDEKARPSSPQHRADKIYKPPGHRTTDHLPMPQGSNQPQRQLVKKNRFQWWLSHHPPLHWDKDIKCAVTGSKPGRDFLLVAFGLQVGIMAYIVLFFHQFGSPVETSALFSLSSSFQTSLLSGYMVGLVFFQVVVVLWDRVAYVYTSLLSKLLSHYFLVVGVHIQLWLVLPLHTGVYLHASPFLVGLYLLQCCAMGVSAAQLKHGYVVFRGKKQPSLCVKLVMYLGNPFSLRHATSAFKTLFSVYMAIPFAFEVRTLLDYLCSTTALDMQLWLVLEGIGAHLFLVKMQMEGRVQDGYILQGNMRQPVLAKFKSAGVYFMALVVCLLAPMIMFSTANPTTINNPVLHATMTFGLLQPDGTFQQLYNSEENESPLTTKVVVANVETLVQQVSFMEYSNDMWSSSPPLRRRLMTRLNSTEGIQWRMTITLKRAAPDGQQIVAYDMVTSITPSQRAKLMRMMDVTLTDESTANSMSSGILTIPDMYPPVLNVPAATPPTAREPYLPRAIQDEARLFETLIRVLRSPETLLKVTGPNIIHIPSKEKLD